MKLYQYQKQGVKVTLENLHFCRFSFIFDEMGLGKTIQAIEVIKTIKPEKTLIVVPPNLKLNWLIELNKAGITSVDLIETSKQQFNSAKDITLCGYSVSIQKYIVDQLLKIQYDMVIFDEVHYLKAQRVNKRVKFFSGFLKTQKKALRLGLTGTPVVNSVIDLWYIYLSLDHTYWQKKALTYLAFCYKFAKSVQHTPYGMVVKGVRNGNKLKELISDTSIRRLKKDVFKELPAKIRNDIFIPANTPVLKKLITKEKHLMKTLGVFNGDEIENLCKKRDVLFEDIAELRQQIGVIKIPIIYDQIKEALDTSVKKLICFVIFHNTANLLFEYLEKNKIKTSLITGLLSGDRRLETIEKFKTSQDQVLLCTLGSVKEGLNIQYLNYCIIGELGWSIVDHIQGEDRLHRIGQVNDCSYVYISVADGFDAHIYELIKEKSRVIDILN